MKFSFAIAALLGLIEAKSLYNPSVTDVTVYTQLNFEKQVTKKRESGISIVHYYKSGGKLKSFYLNSQIQMANPKNKSNQNLRSLLPKTRVFSELDQLIAKILRLSARKKAFLLSQPSSYTHLSQFQPPMSKSEINLTQQN